MILMVPVFGGRNDGFSVKIGFLKSLGINHDQHLSDFEPPNWAFELSSQSAQLLRGASSDP